MLPPRGGRIHAPWAMAAAAKIRQETGVDVETLWGDDSSWCDFRMWTGRPIPLRCPIPRRSRRSSSVSSADGAFCREVPRELRPGPVVPKAPARMRAPLWQQRKRAADLLAVASRYGSFPILLETYRECLRDFFDMSARQHATEVQRRKIRATTVDPTAVAVCSLAAFSYVASFYTAWRAPLAERGPGARGRPAALREFLATPNCELLTDAMEAIERQLQRLEPQFRSADAVQADMPSASAISREELLERGRTWPPPTASMCCSPHMDRVGADCGERFIAAEVAALPRWLGADAAARASRLIPGAGARSAWRSGGAVCADACRSPPHSSPRDTRLTRGG